MSLFTNTEEFYAAQDDFRRFLATQVNPCRRASGLEEISDIAARECFRIFDQYSTRWIPSSANPAQEQT